MIGVPDEKWGETIKALVVVRPGDDGRPRPSSSRTAATGWPTSRRRRASSSATRSTAPRPASCRSTSCASPTGPGGRSRSTRGRSPRHRRLGSGVGASASVASGPAPERSSSTRWPRRSKAAATSPAMSRRSGSPTMVRRQPVSRRLGSSQSSWAMSARVASRRLVEVEVVGDLAHQARAHGDGAGRGRRVPPRRRHADLVGGRARARGGRPPRISAARPWARWRPSTPAGAPELVRVVGRPLRDRQQPEVGQHHAPGPVRSPRPCARATPRPPGPPPRERRDMLRMSPSFHHASSGTRAGVRSLST